MNSWLLGSGGWFPTQARETTSLFARDGEHGLLIDAGTGARRLLTSAELVDGVTAIDVVLTHFHLDHICGLLYLPGLMATGHVNNPPSIWAPGEWLYDAASAQLLDGVLRSPVSPFPAPVVSGVHELRPGSQRVGPFEVSTLAQPRHWDPSVGVRVDDEFALITGTAREAEHADFAGGVSHLLHEAWSTSADPLFSDYDATARDAATTAAQAGVQRLTLIHLNPLQGDLGPILDDARAAFEATQLGEDGNELI